MPSTTPAAPGDEPLYDQLETIQHEIERWTSLLRVVRDISVGDGSPHDRNCGNFEAMKIDDFYALVDLLAKHLQACCDSLEALYSPVYRLVEGDA